MTFHVRIVHRMRPIVSLSHLLTKEYMGIRARAVVIWNWASHWVLIVGVRLTVVIRYWAVRHMVRMMRIVRGVRVVVVHVRRWIITGHVWTVMRVRHVRMIIGLRILILGLIKGMPSYLAVLLLIWMAMSKIKLI